MQFFQGTDYTTGCLLDYPYFKKYYKLIVIDFSKQDADRKAIQKINFNGNVDWDSNTEMFFLLKKKKKQF